MPTATPVGLDTKDPEVQLSVLRWMMSKRVGEVRIFAGRWVRRPGPVHGLGEKPHALEKGTHPRNHQVGGLPWARYSVDELNQQATYPGDLRSIFWAAPHDPDEDFYWTRQISSWTLRMFGHSYTLRQLWESGSLCHCCRALGSGAQNQTRQEDRSGDGLPGHGQGPRAFLTDTPAEVMQLPAQDVADSRSR